MLHKDGTPCIRLQPWVRVGTGKGGGKTQPGQHATTQQQRRGVPPCIRPAVVLLPAPPVGVPPTAAKRVSPRDLQRISQEYMVSSVPRQFCGKGASSPTLVHHPELHAGVSPVSAAIWIASVDPFVLGSKWLNEVQANLCDLACFHTIATQCIHVLAVPRIAFSLVVPFYKVLGCRSLKCDYV